MVFSHHLKLSADLFFPITEEALISGEFNFSSYTGALCRFSLCFSFFSSTPNKNALRPYDVFRNTLKSVGFLLHMAWFLIKFTLIMV